MTLNELVAFVRSDFLDDVKTPYLWSDAQLLRYANEACLEAAMRAPLITRSYSKPIAIDKPDVVLDPSVRRITLAKLAGDTLPLQQTSDSQLSLFVSGSWRETKGNPRYYIRNGTKFRLYPIPIATDTLVLLTTNIPDDDFDIEEDIDSAYHKDLAYWIVYKAYLMRDEETYNPMKAKEFYALFEQAFGFKHSAKYDNALFSLPVNPIMTGGGLC